MIYAVLFIKMWTTSCFRNGYYKEKYVIELQVARVCLEYLQTHDSILLGRLPMFLY